MPWWPQIDLVYARSEGLRHLFTDTLQKATQGYIAQSALKMIQQITQKAKDGPSRSVRSEDWTAHKTLLLLMVRLVHADPMLLMNVKTSSDHLCVDRVCFIAVSIKTPHQTDLLHFSCGHILILISASHQNCS